MIACLSSLVTKGPSFAPRYLFFSGALLFSMHSTMEFKKLKCGIFREFD